MDCRRKLLSLLGVVGLMLTGALPASAELVHGQVRNASSGEPLARALVTCGEETVLSAADGSFSIAAADTVLKVRSPGYRRAEVPFDTEGAIDLPPFTPRALYLSFYGVGAPVLRDPALELIDRTDLNALVIDVKGDRGMISYRSSIARAAAIGGQDIITVRDPKALLASLKARGIYTIARIVVFKDELLARARPELAVITEDAEPWRDGEGLSWVDPFSPEVWDYNIEIAEEAASLGFDEIQFDYVRFPDRRGLAFMRENTEANRVEAISSFLAAARQRLVPYNVYLSADVFGYVCWNRNDTQIGQRLEALAAHLDYISPMLYPSGFSNGIRGYRNPVENPYEIVSLSLNKARERTGLSPVRFRPWLQAFRDYAFDRRAFGVDEIGAQTQASEDFGANGWMLWNARNVYRWEGPEPRRVEAKADIEPATAVQ